MDERGGSKKMTTRISSSSKQDEFDKETPIMIKSQVKEHNDKLLFSSFSKLHDTSDLLQCRWCLKLVKWNDDLRFHLESYHRFKFSSIEADEIARLVKELNDITKEALAGE
jgi:hypothetical protein